MALGNTFFNVNRNDILRQAKLLDANWLDNKQCHLDFTEVLAIPLSYPMKKLCFALVTASMMFVPRGRLVVCKFHFFRCFG